MASKLDYEKLGLKVGLEIHQQLDTKHKLFCDCPTKLVDVDKQDEFERRLRPTQSELGEVDIAAFFEWKRGRIYHYESPRTSSCLVETDEEPPHELNREALTIALAIAKALHSNIVDEIHVMRKIVIDGSNTTGFQRTAIISLGGYIEVDGKRYGVQTICLEEDAARKVGEEGKKVRYRLDRLGIPLIEIATSPDIHSPEEAEKVALAIGQLLRLTGKVKRGIGTIRQDLNISIEGGVKTEIKGVQRLDLLPKVIEYEVQRQLKLLEIRDELRKRGVREEDLVYDFIDVTDVFKKTQSKVIRRTIASGGKVLAVKLPGFKGLLGVELQPNRRFGTELADYARFWGGVGGLFHSDELPKYGISKEEVEKVYEKLKADPSKDAFVIIADKEEKAREALKAVVDRAREALKGIPKETRAANPDGTTRYMRPQPGAARMYPETDIPPVEITEELLKEAEKLVPEPPQQKLKKLIEQHGLSKELAQQVLRSIHLALYEELVEKYGDKVPATVIANTIVSTLKALKGEGVPVENIEEHHIEDTIRVVAEGKASKEAIPEILAYLAKHPEKNAEQAIKELGIKVMSMSEVEKIIDEIVKEMKPLILQRKERAMGPVMGRAMAKLRGKVEGRIVAQIVSKKIKELIESKGEDKQ
ncbi:MAG TPA: Glu-tRNA(Gln) amidotransferase subunit GatE [Desulfurococcaceae archaeon]|nr:Glu-tRNA(Gln) amidotransferase subunit GatE [Desulfurococcaceae archaeon]